MTGGAGQPNLQAIKREPRPGPAIHYRRLGMRAFAIVVTPFATHPGRRLPVGTLPYEERNPLASHTSRVALRRWHECVTSREASRRRGPRAWNKAAKPQAAAPFAAPVPPRAPLAPTSER
jgi:hypothetical protein